VCGKRKLTVEGAVMLNPDLDYLGLGKKKEVGFLV
jgi:hypothetical protein